MLITEVDITIEAGKGGNGKIAYENKVGSGPNGGDGGRGGSVYVIATNDVFALNRYVVEKILKAQNGDNGNKNKRDGAAGKDLVLKFPIGTILHNKVTGRILNVIDTKKSVKIAKGGQGGKGNFALRFRNSTSHNYFQKGEEGTKLEIMAELKLVASFGLIGLPNAGKSSLLNELTRSNVKVADYPFTTLEPNIGNLGDKVIADIPGLIEGASEGKGLGTKFLKHIEKVGLILHCVNADSVDIKKDYEIVRNEIRIYRRDILDRPKIILLTKSDMVTKEELEKKKKIMEEYGYKVVPVSIHDWDSLEELKKLLIVEKKTPVNPEMDSQ